MKEDTGFKKILKIAGIVALIAVPVFLIIKKKKKQSSRGINDDDSNIFSSDLEN